MLSQVDNRLVNIPVNINTVNALCNTNIQTTKEMNNWLKNNQVQYEQSEIDNSEKMAKSRVGTVLYNKLFKDYTYKQWNRYPEELDPSVLERIPVRDNFDNRYFTDKFQALPEKGYTEFIQNMLNHKNITVQLNTDYFDFIKEQSNFEHIIYCGPIDSFYQHRKLAKLEYRSIEFITEKLYNTNYYQSNSVINFPDRSQPFTRIVEYKHFLNQKSDHTIIVKEITKETGEPYYPIPNKKNQELYEQYRAIAKEEKNIHFLGRLANYKYFNMDAAILNALEYFDNNFSIYKK